MVGVMEKNGSIINREDGIDPKDLEDYTLANGGSILDFPGAQPTDENLLIAECDFLIPAAGEQQITAEIAKQVKAKVCLSHCVRAGLVWVWFHVIGKGWGQLPTHWLNKQLK